MSPSAARIIMLVVLLAIASGTIGSTCVIVEEGPDDMYDDPGENYEAMEEQEYEIEEESDR
jgi:hypothetical protein